MLETWSDQVIQKALQLRSLEIIRQHTKPPTETSGCLRNEIGLI